MRKRLLFFERKIHEKCAINFVIHNGKGVDKIANIEGKCHWHEQYLNKITFWGFKIVGIIKWWTKDVLLHFCSPLCSSS